MKKKLLLILLIAILFIPCIANAAVFNDAQFVKNDVIKFTFPTGKTLKKIGISISHSFFDTSGLSLTDMPQFYKKDLTGTWNRVYFSWDYDTAWPTTYLAKSNEWAYGGGDYMLKFVSDKSMTVDDVKIVTSDSSDWVPLDTYVGNQNYSVTTVDLMSQDLTDYQYQQTIALASQDQLTKLDDMTDRLDMLDYINNNLIESNSRLTQVNINLSDVSTAIRQQTDENNSNFNTMKTNIDITNAQLQKLNYRISFAIYSALSILAFICIWMILKNLVIYPFRRLMSTIF